MPQHLPPAAAATPLAGPWIAAPRPGVSGVRWMERHRAFVARAARGDADVLFLGDSLTEYWTSTGRDAWDRLTAPYAALDFGLAGDRTQYLLWRVTHGELDGLAPRAVVLLIGTNNLGAATPEHVARGVAAVVAAVRARLPASVVLLHALLPRGAPDDPLRAKAAEVNALVAPLADGEHVRWVDFGDRFVDPDGTIPAALMPDGLHLSPAGYELWAAALAPLLAALLGT